MKILFVVSLLLLAGCERRSSSEGCNRRLDLCKIDNQVLKVALEECREGKPK